MSETSHSGIALFIADLHLHEERPLATGRFFRFLEDIAAGADSLYILGDLFEYWPGDDDAGNDLANKTAAKLKILAESGTPVHFMHGNRDFLLAQDFASKCAMSLLADPTVVDLFGTPTLLTHGDLLCTDDTRYQQFRRLVRHHLVQKLLLHLPLKLRHVLAGAARSGSERAKAGKSYEVMDANGEAVQNMFKHFGVARMVHGHTHRPARHQLMVDGNEAERWVLPDWYGEGGYLACTRDGCELHFA